MSFWNKFHRRGPKDEPAADSQVPSCSSHLSRLLLTFGATWGRTLAYRLTFKKDLELVVINLEWKQVDTKTFLAMKGYVTFVQVTKSKMKIISY